MFSKLILIAAALAGVASALPTGGPSGEGGGQCASGNQYCCNSIQSSSSLRAANVLGGLVAVLGTDVSVGLTCNPIGPVPVLSGNSWKDIRSIYRMQSFNAHCGSQQPVCCSGSNFFNGAVVVGCSPINL